MGFGELVVVLLIVLLLFGAKRLPDLAKSLGKSVRSFKEGMNDITDDPSKDDKDSSK